MSTFISLTFCYSEIFAPFFVRVLPGYKAEQYGKQFPYCYNCFKIENQDDEALLGSDNPFDLMIYATNAAKKEALFKGKEEKGQKFKYLRALTRLLAGKGWSERDKGDLLILIARVINLEDRSLL